MAQFAVPGALSVLGAILGGKQARAQNKAIRAAAEENFRRLNDVITQTRVDHLRETERLSRGAGTAIGNTMNALPRSLAVTTAIANRIVANVSSDQFAIDETASRRIRSINSEKQSVALQASAGMVAPAAAALKGGLEGFQMGMGLMSAFGNLTQAETIGESVTEMGKVQNEIQGIAKNIAGTNLKVSALDLEFARLRHQRSIGAAASDEMIRAFHIPRWRW